MQAKLEQLSRIHAALDELIASCPGGGDVKACTILDAMQRKPDIANTKPSTATSTSEKGVREMKTTTLTIKGMHCDGCARTIEALLSHIPGVRKAEVSFDERRARILHDQNTASTTDLTAAIAKGGFTASASKT
ncbi:cation transporter [Fodinicurvata halophila]|uniref:cation transporter n=1 Tax=Fodinicurvata halophila TaxID=1419723 RepID=UPI0036391816